MTESTLIRKLKQERTYCEQRAVTGEGRWYRAQANAISQAMAIVRAAYAAERKRAARSAPRSRK